MRRADETSIVTARRPNDTCLAMRTGYIGMLGTTLIMACGGGTKTARHPHALTPPKPKPAVVKVPEWVMTTPSKKGRVCAVGAVDPTYYRQDGRTNAAEAARNELARSVQVHIYSVMYDVETIRGSSTRQYVVSEVETAVHDGVISGAEVLGTWFDETGTVSRKGMTYALACMDTDQSVAQLAEKLEQVLPPEEQQEAIAQVRDRARAAFDQLEAEEDKRQSAQAEVASPSEGTGAPDQAPLSNER